MAARNRRVVLAREDPLAGLTDNKIKKAYRFTRAGVLYLADMLQDDLEPRNQRNSPLSPLMQLCITLMYFAGGSLLYQIARAHRVSSASVSRSIRKVTLALVRRRSEVGNLFHIFIHFPSYSLIYKLA